MLKAVIKKQLPGFNLDVEFEAGNEVLALLGASGCGKSMTLKCIAGIEKPDSGYIELDGKVLFDSRKRINLPPQKRGVGYLFQNYALFPNMTILQNITAGVRDGSRQERTKTAHDMIVVFKLEGLENKRPHQLSGGQQQRAALARILVNRPSLLLLDEPFSALDSYLKWQLELELLNILSSYEGSVLFVSHNRDEVYRLCESVCVLTNGHSENKMSIRELFEAPKTLSACRISGCKNFSRLKSCGANHVEAADWGVKLYIGNKDMRDAEYIGVRSHNIKPVAEEGENTFLCGVESVIEDTFSTVIMLSTPGDRQAASLIRAEISKEEWVRLNNPAQLLIHIAPSNIMLLKSR